MRLVAPQCETLEGTHKPKLCLVHRDGRDDGPAMTLGLSPGNPSFRGISLGRNEIRWRVDRRILLILAAPPSPSLAMSQNKIFPIDVVDFRADNYSSDGKSVVVSLTTKYSAERRTYALPLACLHSFIADLQKLYAPP